MRVQSGVRRTASAGVLTAVMAGLFTFAGMTPAHAACSSNTVDLLVTFTKPSGTSCSDLNISWASTKRTDLNGTVYWGEYYSNGAWRQGAAGRIWMYDGNQSPWKVFITNIQPGTSLRMRGDNGAFVTYQI